MFRAARVRFVDLTGVGGECSWVGDVTPIQRSVIAWSGVLAQLVLFVIVVAALQVVEFPSGAFAGQLVMSFMFSNLWLAAFNLIPFKSLDGVQAWKIIPLLWRKRKQAARAGAAHRRMMAMLEASTKERELRALDDDALEDEDARRLAGELLEKTRTKRGD